MQNFAISTNHLTKIFNENIVIQDCNFNVEQGTLYGFLGKNGAGKTTMFKLLLGLLKPSAGSACILGLDTVQDNQKILQYTGSIIETPIFYEHLSAKDNLLLHLAYIEIEDADVNATLEKVGLPNTGSQPVYTFSLGMRQRLAIARAIIHKPKVLILDEPVNGLDPVGIKEMRILFRDLVENEGMTILLSSHLLSEIEQIAEKVGVLVDGHIVKEITMNEIRSNYPSGIEDYFLSIVNRGMIDE